MEDLNTSNLAMDELNTSNTTHSFASNTQSSLGAVSFMEFEVATKYLTFHTDSSSFHEFEAKELTFNTDASSFHEIDAKDITFNTDDSSFESFEDECLAFDVDGLPVNADDGGPVFEMASFPTNPTLTDSSASSSSSVHLLPEAIKFLPRRSHPTIRQRQQPRTPYAQLCFCPKTKTVVTCLEIDIIRGRRKHHSRLPLDSPWPEQFPWLHQDSSSDHRVESDGMTELPPPLFSSGSYTSSNACSKSTVSSMSDDQLHGHGNDTDSHHEDLGEPIILSGWMMDHECMSDEEADIYWLLNDGKDVWVKLDDGCAKALRKMWTSCSQWKLKRYRYTAQRHHHQPQEQPESPDARDEKRFRYSMLQA